MTILSKTVQFFSARFGRRLLVPPLLNLFHRTYMPLLFKLHALNLVN